MQNLSTRAIAIIGMVLAILLGGGSIVFQAVDDEGNVIVQKKVKLPKPAPVVSTVNADPGDGHPTTTVTAPGTVFNQVAAGVTDKKLKDETPPLAQQVAPGQLTAAQQAAARIRATQPPLPTAGASAGFKGCATHFVRNQSSRGGVRPQWFVLHYTVSHNVAGLADVNSVLGLFDRSSAQASSNFIIDAEGNCAYAVPIEAKSWTQAAANPFSISVEIIAFGNESVLMGTPGYAKLASVALQVSQRTGIPLSAGSTNGCAPGSSGIVQHADFGICGGGHHDIQPFSKTQTIRIIQKLAKPVKPITKAQRERCHELNKIRAKAHDPKRSLNAHERKRRQKISRGEARNGLQCLYPPKKGRAELVRR